MNVSLAEARVAEPTERERPRTLVGTGLMTLAVGAIVGIGLGLQIGTYVGILGDVLLAIGAFQLKRAWLAVGAGAAGLATTGVLRIGIPDAWLHQVDHAILACLMVAIVAALFVEAFGARKTVAPWVPYVAVVGAVGDFYHGVATAIALPGDTSLYELASAFPLAVAAFVYGFLH